jgi:hypothetical protein
MPSTGKRSREAQIIAILKAAIEGSLAGLPHPRHTALGERLDQL